MIYTLMRKDTPLVALDMSRTGDIIRIGSPVKGAEELLPLQNRLDENGLVKWWNNRAVPIQQGHIREMLEKKGYVNAKDFLVDNLGLSLTDYYWIRPANEDLSWRDVSLFSNDFKGNLEAIEELTGYKNPSCYTPNSSLQGQLEKSWIISNGKRMLIKGNRDNLSCESINEYIATKTHQAQQFTNFTPYQLIHIAGKDYDYGCVCELFTSEQRELIPAYDIVTSEKKPNDVSTYEHFISICKKHGMDEDALRRDLEYQILTDFIFTNTDRHLNNIAILRDAKTLKFLQLAPIFDSGKSFFVGKPIPSNPEELLDISVTSFASKEKKLLSYVHDKSLVDCQKLLSPEKIKEIYMMDSQIDECKVDRIVKAYEMKIELL